MKKVLVILLAIAVLCLLLFISIDVYTTKFIPEHTLSSIEYKIWSHAGFTKNSNIKKNTIEAFDRALNNGATGLEFDVNYDVNLKRFIVSHDFPYQTHNGNLLFLDSVFHRYKNKTKYWLDFKNLKGLAIDDIKESHKILKSLIEKERIQPNNILIESTNLENLSYYTKNGFYTSWWILPYKSRYKSILRDYRYKYYYITGKYSSLSMPYKYYHRVENHMNNVPINLWTINSSEHLNEHINKKQVKIILTDENWFLK